MKFNNENAVLFIPDGTEEGAAVARTTSMCVSAHQDDIEFMCYQGILDCFASPTKWFSAVVMTDGAGSPRAGIYGDYTDEQMKAVRVVEQKKAAYVGEYGSQFLLGYTSSQIKDPICDMPARELAEIFRKAKPEVVYTHNFADKHDTHVGVASKVIKALRMLDINDRPKKVYGCEVWRDLDWVVDESKTVFDVSGKPSIAASLVGVFDSQICGGKRYDLAAIARRTANATFSASHGCDEANALTYAIDMTPLIRDDKLSPLDFINGYIDEFKADVKTRVEKVNG